MLALPNRRADTSDRPRSGGHGVALWAKIAALSILVSVVAALAINELHHIGTVHARDEVRLTELESRAVDLRATVWSTAFDSSAPGHPGQSYGLDTLSRQLAAFTEGAQGYSAPDDLGDAAARYRAAAASIRDDLAAGNVPRAQDTTRVSEYAFAEFRALLGQHRTRAVDQSELFQKASAFGTVAISIGAAAAICFIAWYMERRHRRTLATSRGELHRLAYFDTLTSLANRLQFTSHLENALLRAQSANHALAVLFLDIDNFKVINDLLGHGVGDAVIAEVGTRIADATRPSDLAARLGGDEFAVILSGVGDLEHAMVIANRILDAMKEPCTVDAEEIAVRCSIGVAYSDDGLASAEELVRNADLAMYAAKARGKACIVAFDPRMHSAVLEGEQMRADLEGACERGEMALYYQPIVDLETGVAHGVEALIRWNHPRRLVLPSVFIPIAESSGAILPIGRWVIREACRQVALWRIAYRDHEMPVVHVNVSARQLEDPELTSYLQHALTEHAVPPDLFVIEITETVMAESDDATIARIEEIRAMGVRIAIDDFGTGFSSLQYLQTLPVDIIKVDQSFVRNMRPGSRGVEVTRAIVDLARRLQLEVVAEGIELEQQGRMLLELGCREGQGYHFAEPMKAGEAAKKLFRSVPQARARAA